MLVRIIKSYKNIVAVCDSELLGKKFESGKFQLDIKESFYKGEEKTGSIFAATTEEAKKILEDSGLISVTLEEVGIGRENPFTPYYTLTK